MKCLVVTNEGNMTYVFLCYQNHTLCYNVFSDHIEEDDIDVRIIGHGIIMDKVRNFLLYADRDIIIFSLLREQTLSSLMKFYLKEIEANCKQRQKIQEANLDSISVRTKDDDEKKVLDMIRSVQDVHGGIHPYKMDLQAMIRSHSDESFNEVIINVIKRLIEDPIRDSMVCNNRREEVGGEKRMDYITDNPAMIDWSIKTKLSRVQVIANFLEEADVDFSEYLKMVEEKLVFMRSVKNSHDGL